MTDHAGYVVTLEQPVKDDEAQALLAAIAMLKGVLSVDPVEYDPRQMVSDIKARSALFNKFIEWWKQ